MFFAALHAVEVSIPDENLEALLRVRLGIPSGPISDTDLASLGSLGSDGSDLAEEERIADLTGLEYAINLEYLQLNNHAISNLLPLLDLISLEYLDLSGNEIRDISSLYKQTNLEFLHLENNRIEYIGTLAAISDVNRLYISNNQISSISALWGWDGAEWIDISYNFLDFDNSSTSSVLAFLESEVLVLGYSYQLTRSVTATASATDFNDAGGDASIEVVSNTFWVPSSDSDWISIVGGELEGFANDTISFSVSALPDDVPHRVGFITVGSASVEIEQGTPVVVTIPDPVLEAAVLSEIGSLTVSHMQLLTSLSIEVEEGADVSEKVGNLSGLEYAMNLENLTLVNSLITNLDPIRELSSLRTFYINGSLLGNAGDLSGLGSLERLTLVNCALEEIPKISDSVIWLSLGENNISDLSPIAEKTQLVELGINRNQIVDIEPLSGLGNLKYLRLDDNLIRYADSLRNLASLVDVQIYRNHITSVEPLMSLTALTNVGLQYNYIDFSEGSEEADQLQQLQLRGVVFYNINQFLPAYSAVVSSDPMGQAGGNGVVAVESNTYWNATTDADWITIVDGVDRFQSSTLEFEVAPAPELLKSRSGVITIANKSVTITQYKDVSIPDSVLEMAIRESLSKPIGTLIETDMAALTSLGLSGDVDASNEAKLSDLSGLEYATNLQALSIQNSLVTNLDPIRELSLLQRLSVYGSPIAEAGDLSGLSSLESLVINSCQLLEVPLFSESVERLDLYDNQIADLSPLAGHIQLTSLELSKNKIVDIEPLSGLTNLLYLRLEDNLIRSGEPIRALKSLLQLSIFGNHLTSIEPFMQLTSLQSASFSRNYIDVVEGSEDLDRLQQLQELGVSVEYGSQYTLYVNISKTSYQIDSLGQDLSVDIGSNTYWSAQAGVDWIAFSESEGFGGDSLELSIALNNDLDERSGAIYIEGVIVTVTQDGVAPDVRLTNYGVNSGYMGGEVEVEVHATTPWRVETLVNWIIIEDVEREGDGVLVITLLPNHRSAGRNAIIEIGSAVLSVSQGIDDEYFSYLSSREKDASLDIHLPNQDADGDGFNNRHEFEVGTDPFDSDSVQVFRIKIESETVLEDLIYMNQIEENVYRVIEYTEDFLSWSVLVLDSEVLENGLILMRHEPSIENGLKPRFYRQRITRETPLPE